MSKPTFPVELLEKARQIRVLITDVDGVLTDGNVYLDNQNNEWKAFNIKDGLGIKLLLNQGIEVVIITGRSSQIVTRRAAELGIRTVYQGRSDKRQAFEEILRQFSVMTDEVAHVGDDLPDLPLMQKSGLGLSVADAHWYVREHADWVTRSGGGQGALREIAELLLTSRQVLDSTYGAYLQP
jgi:3-deoxy-D-manno-octulosonate 8-phosphate phosphatase (KDO 8-P phosphatase)